MQRRHFTKSLGLVLISLAAFPAAAAKAMAKVQGNFRKVYLNGDLRNQFYNFLKNVFHLVPEDDMHELLTKTTKQNESDRAIYLQAQSQLGEITPYFSVLTYQLPSLWKQKEEMAKQTVGLLGEGTTYEGYLEIGSSGRYLDYLEEHCEIEGQRYYSDGKEPGYSISEMIDRGQIAIGAKYIPMADYRTEYSRVIGHEKLELITVYIGFHHCPLELRTRFISSVRDTLKPGGKLVLRDHDCHDDDQRTIVALAHDVFNLGTKESWEYNEQEIRNFYSLDFIIGFVENIGFRFEQQTLFQEGDPTRNALMLFTKI